MTGPLDSWAGAACCAGADSPAAGDSRWAGAGSCWLGADSCGRAVSCAGVGSWLGVDSGEPEEDSGEAEDRPPGLACCEFVSGTVSGAVCGGCSVLADPAEELLDEGVEGPVPERLALVAEPAASVLPGKACAASSASTPVRVTLPAISQRLTRVSLRSAASRVCVLCERTASLSGDGRGLGGRATGRIGGWRELRHAGSGCPLPCDQCVCAR